MTRQIVTNVAGDNKWIPTRRMSSSSEDNAPKKDAKITESEQHGDKQQTASPQTPSPFRSSRRPFSFSGAGQMKQEEPSQALVPRSEDSMLRDEEEFGAYPSPRDSIRALYVDEKDLHSGPCAELRQFFQITWDVLRSVPLITCIWAGGAICAANFAVHNILKLGSRVPILGLITGHVFHYMKYGLYGLDAIDGALVLFSIFFTGATLEILVKRNCSSTGFAGFCQRLSFRSLQGLFFPLSYLTFLATLGTLLLTTVLAMTTIVINQSCADAGTTSGSIRAASDLNGQVNTVVGWMGLKPIDISSRDLMNYCVSRPAISTWFWRMLFIWAGAATFCQLNLTLSAWNMYLNTGFAMRKTDMARHFNGILNSLQNQLEVRRPTSVRSDVSSLRPRSGRSVSTDHKGFLRRPLSAGRTERKEYNNEEIDV